MMDLVDATIRDALVHGCDNDEQAGRVLDIARPFLQQALDLARERTLQQAADRSFALPLGASYTLSYVPVEQIRLNRRSEHIPVADVQRAFDLRLKFGHRQPWPPIEGFWSDDGRFVATSGHADFLACLMLGLPRVMATWDMARAPIDESADGVAKPTIDGPDRAVQVQELIRAAEPAPSPSLPDPDSDPVPISRLVKDIRRPTMGAWAEPRP